MKTDKHISGRVAELEAERYLSKKGYAISYPTTEERYDFILDDGGDLFRVQVKCGYTIEKYNKKRLCVEFRAGTNNKPYTEGEVDVFIIYNPLSDCLYCMDYEDVPDGGATSRLPENWSEYDIDKRY